MWRCYLLKTYMTLEETKEVCERKSTKSTETGKTSDLRDLKPQKSGGHWDAHLQELYVCSALRLLHGYLSAFGHFAEVTMLSLIQYCYSQALLFIFSPIFFSPVLCCCYTACIGNSWSFFPLTAEGTFEGEGSEGKSKSGSSKVVCCLC